MGDLPGDLPHGDLPSLPGDLHLTTLIVAVAIIFALFYNDAAHVPYCNQVHMFRNFYREGIEDVAVYNFSMDLTLSVVDEWNTMLSFSNFVSWSADPSLYYQDKTLRYLTNGESDNPYINCPTMNGPCNITVFNGAGGTLQIPIHLDGTQDYHPYTYIYNTYIFDKGTLYTHGNFFDPHDTGCQTIYDGYTGSPIFEQYSCTNYLYVTIPDSPPLQCTNFESNTTFSTSEGTVIASFTAAYAYTSSNIEYSINPLLLSPNYPLYEFYPNRPHGNWMNVSFPMTFVASISKDHDFQVDASLSIKNAVFDAQYGGLTIAGRILRRNGILLKDHQNPYTPDDPCSTSVAPIYSGTQATNNFCCTKFQNQLLADNCAEYQSFTKVYNNEVYEGIYFNVKYLFNDTNIILTIQSYGNPKSSTLSVEAYSTDLFSQTCIVSTDSPTNTCVFKLSATGQYTLQYRTSINRDSVNMTSINMSGNQIFDPYITTATPCQSFYNFDMSDHKHEDRALTEFCCIDKAGGNYPGGLSSTGYLYPFDDQRFDMIPQQQKEHDVKMTHLKNV